MFSAESEIFRNNHHTGAAVNIAEDALKMTEDLRELNPGIFLE